MNKYIEQLKFDIVCSIPNVENILYFNDKIEKEFNLFTNKKLSFSFVSDNIEARCRFRKHFKRFNILNVAEKVNIDSYDNIDSYICSEEMLNKYLNEIPGLITFICSFKNASDFSFTKSFDYLYYFNLSEKNGCYIASLETSKDYIDSAGIIVASNVNLKLEKFYAVSLNIKENDNYISNINKAFNSEKYWIDFLNSEIKRTQKNSYLILGPLIVIKRLAIHWAKAIPLCKKLYKLLKTYKEGGIKLVWQRINTIKKQNTLDKNVDYSYLFNDNYEYVDFDSEYQENIKFSNKSTDIKMLAFYLPQFHTFKENNEWWGEGFTEWTNTKASKPMFNGHYQPRVPHKDIGYYDLSDINILKKQINLAKEHGIYGFCFYYYWFSGKRLMEKPVDMLLNHKEIDFPFCMCWANENWTRAWDGQSKNVLIKQDYSDDDDNRFINDLKKYIVDERYIKINGKPLIIVYNPGQIPDCKKSFSVWRKTAKEIGIGDILIWTCQTANNTAKSLEIEDYIDAEVEFPPHNTWLKDFAIKNVDLKGKSASIFNYQKLVEALKHDFVSKNDLKEGSTPLHRGCMMAWDNAARRKNNWFTYHNFSLKSLYDWVTVICAQARRDFKEEERFVFINAWNEWAEGTYLEPDEKYGYANINTVSKALFNIPFDDSLLIINNNDIIKKDFVFSKRIAVQIHMFYLETIDETIESINKIPFDFDCFISTDTYDKAEKIKALFSSNCKCSNLTVQIFENRGRDVLPFLLQLKDKIDDYDFIYHIHSKKTVKTDHGNDWRRYIFKNLLGSSDYIKTLFYYLEKEDGLGMIFPKTFPPLEYQAQWGGNLSQTQMLLSLLNSDIKVSQNLNFPVGNMFLAKTEAIREMFKIGLDNSDFPKENGQENFTLAHSIERSWVFLINDFGFHHKEVYNNSHIMNFPSNKRRIAFYVHYNKENKLSNEDISSLIEYKKHFDDIVVVSNSLLSEEDFESLIKITKYIYLRENEGYDFGAWKYGLEKFGYEKLLNYQQVVLINNSILPPVYNIEYMFDEMDDVDVDFWGVTLFPHLHKEKFLGTRGISEHLQSYFIVFEKSVILSNAIKDFFSNLEDTNTFKNAVKNGEVALTTFMKKKGFSYSPYINECYYLSNYLNNYRLLYDKPATLLYLGSPFVKKKAYEYMNIFEKQKLDEALNKIN